MSTFNQSRDPDALDSGPLDPSSMGREPATHPVAFTAQNAERPEPGLARGMWEAPAFVFWVVAAAALLGGVWLVAGLLRPQTARRPTPGGGKAK